MSLTNGQIPKVAVTPNGGVGVIAASANTGTLGADANGATCYTANATYGGRVYGLMGSTNDTVTVNVFVWILNGATVKPLGIVNIPLSSGNALNVPNVDLLDGSKLVGTAIDNTGKRYIPLMPGEVLRVAALANLTTAKSCWITAIGADYAL